MMMQHFSVESARNAYLKNNRVSLRCAIYISVLVFTAVTYCYSLQLSLLNHSNCNTSPKIPWAGTRSILGLRMRRLRSPMHERNTMQLTSMCVQWTWTLEIIVYRISQEERWLAWPQMHNIEKSIEDARVRGHSTNKYVYTWSMNIMDWLHHIARRQIE